MRWTDGLRLLPAAALARASAAQPYKVLLSLTDRCTHRCRHCAAWRRRPGDELSPDRIHALLAGLPSLRWLDLTGGEPTGRPDADAVADAVRDAAGARLAFLHFATNGHDPGAAARFADRLRGPCPLVVTVRLDGDEATHDRVRGRRGAFQAAVETARALSSMPGVQVYAGTTLCPDNVDRMDRTHDALARALPDLVPARWHVNPMTRSPHFFGNLDAVTPATPDVLAALDRVERLRGTRVDPFALAERVFLRGLRSYLLSGRPPVPCQAARASVFVGPRGDVYPCHVLDTPLGNVGATPRPDLRAVLRSPAARAARAGIAAGCSACWTPCEAYHAILGSPVRAVLAALVGRGL